MNTDYVVIAHRPHGVVRVILENECPLCLLLACVNDKLNNV